MKQILTADGSVTLFSTRYQQAYHSRHGALTESQHVFLEATGIHTALTFSQPCTVLELGFGLSMNFLLTAETALTSGTSLNYTAFEFDPIALEDFEQLAMDPWYQSASLTSDVAALLRQVHSTPSENQFQLIHGDITLQLIVADISGATLPEARFDAIYHDAFSPDVNAECWTLPLFQRLYQSLRPPKKDGAVARLATYCAKSSVRRALQHAGFHVERRPGAPGKREMLVGFRLR